jgi:hypothetical protein
MKTSTESVLFLGGIGTLVFLGVRAGKKERQAAASANTTVSGLSSKVSSAKASLASLTNSYNQVVANISSLNAKISALEADMHQNEATYQSQKALLSAQISQAQQQVQSALQPTAISTADPDGYSQAQLMYMEAHPAAVPSGDTIFAQGGYLYLGHSVDGSSEPIIPTIHDAYPTQGDPGFIVGDTWYPTLALAEAESKAIGQPWHGAIYVDPSEFDQYIAKPSNSSSVSHSHSWKPYKVSFSNTPPQSAGSYLDPGSTKHYIRSVVVTPEYTYITSIGNNPNGQPVTIPYRTSDIEFRHGEPGLRGSDGEFFPATVSVQHGIQGYYGSNGKFYPL